MKVIFLDFDGVMNSAGSFNYEDRRRTVHKEQGVKGRVCETFCNVCAANFQMILDKYPDVKIVISSTWRLIFDLEWIKAKLKSYHVDETRVIGRTDDLPMRSRGQEIDKWLKDNPGVTHYIVIDDNDDEISMIHDRRRFVHTTWEGGLTFNLAEEAMDKLSNWWKKNLEIGDQQ